MQEPQTDANVHIICDKERKLAWELKACCTSHGKERESALYKSSIAMFNLGKLYCEKAVKSSGMLQKLTFIRAAALINGSKVRFQLLQDKKSELRIKYFISEANELLTELGKNVLKAANSHSLGGLLDISNELFEDVKKMRKKCISQLESLNFLSLKSKDDKTARYELTKDVKSLTDSVTVDYISIMDNLSRKCIKLLGPAPCMFASVGLGSLARKEITPYSDFEHVIILEEGLADYEVIKEYFRWYAVCFQIIIINFGETFVRSVGVKCLNDLTSEDKSKNWFYDAYTPCGISFDGMVPHSCNNPLGRQEPTKKRPHTLELIQPVNEMAKFTKRESLLKNGYYLNEILTRTCFVNGDAELYQTYRELTEILITDKDYIETAQEQSKIKDSNINPHVPSNKMMVNPLHFEMKQLMYRPITVLLSCIGRLRKIHSPSSFDIISELQAKKIVSKDLAEELKYSLALACLTRMKLYAQSRNQRHGVEGKFFIKWFGFENYTNFCIATEKLREMVRYFIYQISKPSSELIPSLNSYITAVDEINIKTICLYHNGMFQEAIEMGEKFIRKTRFPKTVSFTILESYSAKVDDDLADIEVSDIQEETLLQNALNRVKETRKLVNLSSNDIVTLFYMEIKFLIYLEKYENALVVCEDAMKVMLLPLDPDTFRHVMYENQIKSWKASLLRSLERYSECVEYCDNMLESDVCDLSCTVQLYIHKSNAHTKLGDTDNGRHNLVLAKEEIERKGKYIAEVSALHLVTDVIKEQFDKDFHEDIISSFHIIQHFSMGSEIQTLKKLEDDFFQVGFILCTVYCALNMYSECCKLGTEYLDEVKKGDEGEREKYKDLIKAVTFRLAQSHGGLGFNSDLDIRIRVDHFTKGIELIESYPCENFIFTMYCSILRLLYLDLSEISCSLNSGDKEEEEMNRKIMHHISLAPTAVRQSEAMQMPMMNYCVQIIFGKVQLFDSNILYMLHTYFSYQLTHPVVYVLRLRYLGREGQPNVEEDITKNSLFRHLLKGYSNEVISYNRGVMLYFQLKGAESSQIFWNVLNTSEDEKVIGKCIEMIYSQAVCQMHLITRKGIKITDEFVY